MADQIGVMCNHVTMNGDGIPCAQKAVHTCFHCKTPVCGQHVRWHRWYGHTFDTAYCVGCDEAKKQGKLHLHD